MKTRKAAAPLVIILLLVSWTKDGQSQESPITLSVRHDHFWGGCSGILILDEGGVKYETDHQKDARSWGYADIKQFEVAGDRRLKLYTFEDGSNWRLGADRTFEFSWSDENVTAQQVYHFLRSHASNPIAASLVPAEIGAPCFEFPAKHLGILKGNDGRLQFTDTGVVFRATDDRHHQSWRYEDVESISSGGPFDLALTTYEQERFHYASRRVYNFHLKEPLSRDSYNSLWRFVNARKAQETR